MGDVDIFYADLLNAGQRLRDDAYYLLLQNSEVSGDDTGIENPAQRPGLRLEMRRRLTQLHDTVLQRVEAASNLASNVESIAFRYNELDAELQGDQ
ncbi:hypothetical protein [Microbacterium sp. YY-01]|uniref:hypothetical protein n=1 Tax=Microbacterium sp. YY-01 TaxID=3421634 RepID=UPI003D18662C